MEGATLLATRSPQWAFAFKDADRPTHLTIPGGIFVARQNNVYSPTTHTVSRGDYYSPKMDVGLVREPIKLTLPPTLTVAGAGSCVITNTGRAPLITGQRFTVEYPTREDSDAQRECIRFANARMTHTSLAEGAALWGAFLATVSEGNRNSVLSERVADEVRTGGSDFLFSLGDLIATCRTKSMDSLTTYHTNWTENVATQWDALSAALSPADVDKVLGKISNVSYRFKPKVRGIVLTPAFGSAREIPTGCQFVANIVFE